MFIAQFACDALAEAKFMHFCAHAGQFRLSLLEESIRDGQGRVFPTTESEPGCPLRRRGRTALGGHPLSAGQVSASRGDACPIGVDGARRRRSVGVELGKEDGATFLTREREKE